MIVNISAYKFVLLDKLELLKEQFVMAMRSAKVNGTILLSPEGINIALAGEREGIDAMGAFLAKDDRLSDINFKESLSKERPFHKVVVHIKDEIIAMRVKGIDAVENTGNHVSPEEFKQWLDEGKEVTVLDTRNEYEMDFGTFKNAINPHIDTFRQFPKAIDELDEQLKEKPLVMFCTGGVRCEKASLLMEQKGFKNVYQLEGGILKYFEKCGGEHWDGNCFVFDDRISVDSNLAETGDVQCRVCHHRVAKEELDSDDYQPGISCPKCIGLEFPALRPRPTAEAIAARNDAAQQ